jgi:hypothetical protein
VVSVRLNLTRHIPVVVAMTWQLRWDNWVMTNSRYPRLSVRLDEALRADLSELAKSQRVSKGHVVREELRAYHSAQEFNKLSPPSQ